MFEGVDFSDFNSVMAAINASAGAPLPEDFYLRALDGLSSSLPPGTTNLFSSGGESQNLLGDLVSDDPNGYSTIASSDVGRFLNDPRTISALERSIDAGVRINGFSNLADALNYPSGNSLWGRVSIEYARQASGSVWAILPEAADGGRIFGQLELQELLNNPRVTEINGIPKADLLKLGSTASIFAALKESYNFSVGYLIGEAYTRGVIGSQASLDSYFDTYGLDRDTNEFYQLAIEARDFQSSRNLAFDFPGSAKMLVVLKGAGAAGDLVEMVLAAGSVLSLYSAGRTDEALELLESSAVSLAGGAAGGVSGSVLALAILGILIPEPSSTAAGIAVVVGAILGGVGGEALAQGIYEELKARMLAGEKLTAEDFADVLQSADGNCFSAGTSILLIDQASKPVEKIDVSDVVLSYDANGTLVPGRVTRTFCSEVSHLLDVHGLKVTPGHATLCGDGMFKGRHVPIIDILLSDGALVQADGTLVRMAINAPVGSVADAFVKLSVAATPEDMQSDTLAEAEMRVGTLLFDREGTPISVLDCLTAERFAFDPETGLVAKPGEAPHRLFWFGRLPRPEDYILTRSQETLEGILTDGEWEGSRSELIAGRLRQTRSMRVN